MLHWLSLATLSILVGCGSSDVTFNAPSFDFKPPEAITSLGVISALDSVTVNGVRYQTTAASVMVNGQAANVSDLKRGQIILLDGMINEDGLTGTAKGIDLEAMVIGPIDSIDATGSRLVVMGQTVLTDQDTIFDPSIDPKTFTGLSVGGTAHVSGLLNATGEIIATRIEPGATSTEVKIIGMVSGLDVANMLFTINRLILDYSNAMVIDLPGGMPANGMLVNVSGSLANGVLLVNQIKVSRLFDLDGNSGERVQDLGFITRFKSPTDFDINGFPALTDANTRFSNGTVDDLGVNIQVTIDGAFTAGGQSILAKQITFGRVVRETETTTFDFTNFTEVSVSSNFNVTITQGTDFLVEVTADKTIINDLDVTQTGSTINIGLQALVGDVQTLEAVVTLPVLNSIKLAGVANGTVNGFSQAQLSVDMSGVSSLRGNSLAISNLIANVTGVSRLDFGVIRPLSSANINVSGVSTATLNMDVGTSLTGTVTGTSNLLYFGTNVNVNVTTDSTSSVTKLGETRP
jgi:hypothetical protein